MSTLKRSAEDVPEDQPELKKTEKEEPRDFLDLPEELIAGFFHMIDPKDAASLRGVNRKLNSIFKKEQHLLALPGPEPDCVLIDYEDTTGLQIIVDWPNDRYKVNEDVDPRAALRLLRHSKLVNVIKNPDISPESVEKLYSFLATLGTIPFERVYLLEIENEDIETIVGFFPSCKNFLLYLMDEYDVEELCELQEMNEVFTRELVKRADFETNFLENPITHNFLNTIRPLRCELKVKEFFTVDRYIQQWVKGLLTIVHWKIDQMFPPLPYSVRIIQNIHGDLLRVETDGESIDLEGLSRNNIPRCALCNAVTFD